MDEQQTPAPEAGDEAVRDEQVAASEATENTEGQVETQPAEGEPDGTPEDQPSKSQQRRERRRQAMDQMRQERDAAIAEKEKLEQKLQRQRETAQTAQAPKESDYATYDQYLVAMAAHTAGQEMDSRQARDLEEQARGYEEQAQSAAEREAAAINEGWDEQVAEAKARYTDFEQVALDDSVPITPAMASVIRGSDQGADLAYHLGKNRQEAARIASMPPLEAARAIGAIEARLQAPPAKTVTNAPEPITPPKTGSPPKGYRANMSHKDFVAWREKGGTF